MMLVFLEVAVYNPVYAKDAEEFYIPEYTDSGYKGNRDPYDEDDDPPHPPQITV